jgi:hypothetical protein
MVVFVSVRCSNEGMSPRGPFCCRDAAFDQRGTTSVGACFLPDVCLVQTADRAGVASDPA